MPGVLRAQGAGVKVGHPAAGHRRAGVSTARQGQLGAELAIKAINAAGGIKSLGGAKLEPVLGDARSTPEGGTARSSR